MKDLFVVEAQTPSLLAAFHGYGGVQEVENGREGRYNSGQEQVRTNVELEAAGAAPAAVGPVVGRRRLQEFVGGSYPTYDTGFNRIIELAVTSKLTKK